MKKLSIITACVCLFLLHSTSFGQKKDSTETKNPKFGVFGQINFNKHTADFRALPFVPNCCPQFSSGSGTGFSVGALYEMPLAQRISLSLRAGYTSYGAKLSTTEATVMSVDGVATPGAFEHTIDTKLSSIIVEPIAQYYITDALSVLAGPSIGYVLQKTYAQKEEIIDPANKGVFLDTQTRIRNQYSGDIPKALSIHAALLGGISYEVPLNKSGTLVAAPEAFYSFGLTPIVSSVTWSANAIRIGISIKYIPKEEQIIIPPPPPPPKIPVLAADVKAYGLNPDGSLQNNVEIKVEEFISTQMTPMLNYIFFDPNSATIPSRYHVLNKNQSQDYRISKRAEKETFSFYYDVLNIIGSRMKQFPNATITIVGCNADVDDEKGNQNLSRQRAENVVAYLRDVWNISDKRMKVQARNLPDKPTKPSDIDGIEENRRVEVYSDTWDILSPVIATDTLRIVSPTTIRFIPTVNAEAGVERWSLSATQQNNVMQRFEELNSPPKNIDWKIDEQKFSDAASSIDYAFEVNDKAKQHVATNPGSIKIDHITIQKKRKERIADKEIDSYNLILFDFDKTDLTEFNKRISDFIHQRINPNAKITITGHTDRIGDADYNQRLSEDRAKATAKALKLTDADVSGVGEDRPEFDNNLPEGRCYNRTVNIIVETPVEK